MKVKDLKKLLSDFEDEANIWFCNDKYEKLEGITFALVPEKIDDKVAGALRIRISTIKSTY